MTQDKPKLDWIFWAKQVGKRFVIRYRDEAEIDVVVRGLRPSYGRITAICEPIKGRGEINVDVKSLRSAKRAEREPLEPYQDKIEKCKIPPEQWDFWGRQIGNEFLMSWGTMDIEVRALAVKPHWQKIMVLVEPLAGRGSVWVGTKRLREKRDR